MAITKFKRTMKMKVYCNQFETYVYLANLFSKVFHHHPQQYQVTPHAGKLCKAGCADECGCCTDD